MATIQRAKIKITILISSAFAKKSPSIIRALGKGQETVSFSEMDELKKL